MQKVLLVCYYFPPMGMGGAQRSTKFVKYLPRFNWEPIVITVKDVHYYAQDLSLLEEIKDRNIIRTESIDPLRLFARCQKLDSRSRETIRSSPRNWKMKWLNWLNHLISGWLLVPDSKILWLPYAVRKSISLIAGQKINIVYTTSPPHSAHIAGMVIKWITGIKWVADFRDDWTGGESQSSPTSVHTFINRVVEKFVLKLADRVIAMCDHLTNNLKRKGSCLLTDKKFFTIMNGYDRDDFSGLENLPLYPQFTITHCGSVSRVSDPGPFLTAIKLLFQKYPDLRHQIRIQFLGTDIFGRLDKLLIDPGLKECVFPIQYLPHREAVKEIMRSHVLLLTIIKKTGEEIITGKVFEYLASGKPILLISSEGAVARILTSLRRGVVIPPDDIQGIQSAILNYFQQYTSDSLTYSKPLTVPQFDRENLTGHLADVFNELTNREGWSKGVNYYNQNLE